MMENTFYPLPLNTLQPGQILPFSIYLRHGLDNYVLYVPINECLSPKYYQHLVTCCISTVYLSKIDRNLHLQYLAEILEKIVQEEEIPPALKASLVNDAAQQIVLEALERPKTENIEQCKLVARSQVQLILSEPDTLYHVLRLSRFDYCTYAHSVNVCFLLVATLKHLDWQHSIDILSEIGHGALLHDIGKTRLQLSLLNKPGKFTSEEFQEIKKHPSLGMEIVQANYPQISPQALSIIGQHHEDMDGGGYPLGLAGEAIPLASRLARIIDIYDALTTNRPYKEAWHSFNAVQMMLAEFKNKIDRKLLKEFIQVVGRKPLSPVDKIGTQ